MNSCFQKISNKIYVNCWICDCIIEYKPSSVGIKGITCKHHNQKYNTTLLEKKISLNLPCEFCATNIYSKVYNGQRGELIKVIDDTRKTKEEMIVPRIKEIGLCYQHFNHFGDWQKGSLSIPKLSNIMEKLGEILQSKARFGYRRKF
jgi:hypothetical protein